MLNPFQSPSQPAAPLVLNFPNFQAVQVLREQGKLSRTHIAELIGYSPSKITSVAGELLDAGILSEYSEGSYTGGRRAKELFFNPNFGYFIAITISSDKLDVALVDFGEQVRIRRMLPMVIEDGPDPVLSSITGFLLERLERLKIPLEKIYGVGITLPGAVNRKAGTLYDTSALPGWGGYQIDSFIREVFPYAVVVIERDAHAMAFAELRHGRGKSHEHFIYLNIGHTVSAGLILEGKIFHGANGRAGDIGSMKFAAGDEWVTLDRLALPMMGKANNGSSPLDMSIAAQEGDAIAQQTIESTAEQIGHALASLITLVDPEIILIGGIAAQLGHPFLASIRRHILDLSQSSTTQHLQVDIAPLGEEATITGIVALTAEQVFVIEE